MLHVMFLTLLRALEVNIDLRHVNHIRYYYYYTFINLTHDDHVKWVRRPRDLECNDHVT